MPRRSLIARIHIAKKDLGIDEDTYRQALQGVTGLASCSGMSLNQLEMVLDHFKRCGWKPKAKPALSKKDYSPKTRNKQNKDMVDKIRAMWIDMHKIGAIKSGSDKALSAWVKRTTKSANGGEGVDDIEWLRSKGGRLQFKVIEVLKKWRSREMLLWQNEDFKLISEEQQATDESQKEAAARLLKESRIFWWPIFADLGITENSRYCCDRRRLKRG